LKIPFDQIGAVGSPFINLSPAVTVAILRTIEAGWLIARQRVEVGSDSHEVAITECLREGMREALAKNKLPWRKTMIILPGTESKSQLGMTKPDGRTDVPLLLVNIFTR
jgi:hypothetical protein